MEIPTVRGAAGIGLTRPAGARFPHLPLAAASKRLGLPKSLERQGQAVRFAPILPTSVRHPDRPPPTRYEADGGVCPRRCRRRRMQRRPSIAATVAVKTTRVSKATRIRTSGRLMAAAGAASNPPVPRGLPHRPRQPFRRTMRPVPIANLTSRGCVMPSPARVQVARPPGMIDRHPGGRVPDRRQVPAVRQAV
jgi:hypothetical protein